MGEKRSVKQDKGGRLGKVIPANVLGPLWDGWRQRHRTGPVFVTLVACGPGHPFRSLRSAGKDLHCLETVFGCWSQLYTMSQLYTSDMDFSVNGNTILVF